jgi:DUF4097 and DUF4098 domain-containing protein YvlB
MSEWKIEAAETIQFDETPTEVDITVVGGEVELEASDGPAALEIRQVTGPEVQVRMEEGRLSIDQRRHPSWRPNLKQISVSLALRVPASCQVRLEAVSASVLAQGFSDDVKLETVSGEITMESLAGPTEASSVSGELNARGQSGGLRGQTVSGDVTLDAYLANTCRVTSVSGEVTADLQQAGSDVSAEVDTVSGAVYLRLASDPSLEVQLESVSGHLTSAFPELITKRSPGWRGIKGKLGEGQGRVKISTVSGAVSLLVEAPA